MFCLFKSKILQVTKSEFAQGSLFFNAVILLGHFLFFTQKISSICCIYRVYLGLVFSSGIQVMCMFDD